MYHIFTDFLLKTISRTIKILLSYLSWQAHEKSFNPVLTLLLSASLFIMILSPFL